MKKLSMLVEWIRPIGLIALYFFAYKFGSDPEMKFHILGPITVIIMSGTVSFESIFLGEAASDKIGYKPNRAYQIQSGLANLAMALTGLIVFAMNWGRFADVTIVIVMLLFFIFSSINHVIIAVKEKDFKPVNLMRPVMALVLAGMLLPSMFAII